MDGVHRAEVLAPLAEEAGAGGDVAFERSAFTDPLLRRRLERLCQALLACPSEAGAALACEEALARACERMLQAHSTAAVRAARDDAAALPQVLDRLADLDAPAPSLAELGALAGLGRFQLLRRFRRAHATTPHAWWLQHRAEQARGLIAQGRPPAEAAAACGFADQSHLHRVFSARFGFTPGAWHRAVRGRPQ